MWCYQILMKKKREKRSDLEILQMEEKEKWQEKIKM